MTRSLAFILLIAVLLHWPYFWKRQWDERGRESGIIRSALYRYDYAPGYDRLTYDGLRRLQTWLLIVLAMVVSRLQPEVIAWIVHAMSCFPGW